MKYIIIDDCKQDIYTSEYNTLEEAINAADKEYARLTEADKKRRISFLVLESDNPDPEAADHLDGFIKKEYICAEDGIF